MKQINKLIFILLFAGITMAQGYKGSISGKVVDADTKLPLTGVNVFIKDISTGAATSADGTYIIADVPVGSYNVEFSYVGYSRQIKTDIIIKQGKTHYLNVDLRMSDIEMAKVVVTGGYFNETEHKPLSNINFSNEEIRRAPGSAGDVSRILFGLPSLSKINDSKNSLIVRGGSPIENSFYLDNIEIQNINHFPVMGSSEGPIGLINVDFIEDVNFSSGGFSAIYGDRMSSVMEMKFREGSREQFETQANFSMAGMGLQFEGPLGNDASFMFSGNKSWLDLMMTSEFDDSPLPSYWDAQGKIVLDLDQNNRLSLLNIYSVDKISSDYEKAIGAEMNLYGPGKITTSTNGVNWRHIWGKTGYSETSVSYNLSKYEGDLYWTKKQSLLYTNKSKSQAFSLRNINYIKLSPASKLEAGFEAKFAKENLYLYFGEYQDIYGNITPPLTVDQHLETLKAAAFFNYSLTLWKYLTINPGLRADYFDYNEDFTISPRLALNLKLGKSTSIHAAVGVYNQQTPISILAQKEKFKDLKTANATHYILGFSQLLNDDTKLTIELYRKDYENLPVNPLQPNSFIFDEAQYIGTFLNHENLVDNGEAYSQGIEIIIQKKLAEKLYGLISGSYSTSQYKAGDSKWRNRVYDNRFNFTVEGGYKPNENWEFSLRWIYAGGAPYTPFDMELTRQHNKGIFDHSKINEARLPDYHSLNVRVDKRFHFSNMNLIIYMSVWNAYGRKNISGYDWNEVSQELTESEGWSTMPILGIELEI